MKITKADSTNASARTVDIARIADVEIYCRFSRTILGIRGIRTPLPIVRVVLISETAAALRSLVEFRAYK